MVLILPSYKKNQSVKANFKLTMQVDTIYFTFLSMKESDNNNMKWLILTLNTIMTKKYIKRHMYLFYGLLIYLIDSSLLCMFTHVHIVLYYSETLIINYKDYSFTSSWQEVNENILMLIIYLKTIKFQIIYQLIYHIVS